MKLLLSVTEILFLADSAAVPDQQLAARTHVGGSFWQWQDVRVEDAPHCPGEIRRGGGCGHHHRPQGHHQEGAVRKHGPQHTRVDRWHIHCHPQKSNTMLSCTVKL